MNERRSNHDYNPTPLLGATPFNDGAVSVRDQGVGSVSRSVEVEKPTKLEGFYRERSKDETLTQFGYDLFYQKNSLQAQSTNGALLAPMGVVQDDYILQVGDAVSATFTGERKGRSVYKIESDGRILVENLPVIQATGKTLGALKLDVEAALIDLGYRGQVSISIDGMRQIGVLIAGHVERPGRHNMNAFHSVIDAIQMAGGVRKTGSLRQVKLIRKGQTTNIDLYGFLTNGRLPERLQLSDGDRIIVPPIGPTIAVVGDVKQAGVFELRVDPRMAWRKSGGNTAHKVGLRGALAMAGGVLSAGDNQFTLHNSASQVINLNNIKQSIIGDGSVLTVTRATDVAGNAVTLSGYSRKNGLYDIRSASTLQALLKNRNVFGDDIYPLIGVISRINRKSLTRKMMGFSPQSIAMDKDDRQLEPGDVVYLFSHDDIADIKNERSKKKKETTEKSIFPKLIRDFVRDNNVTVQGAVRDSGAWPVGGSANLKTLISVSGGLTPQADLENVELVSRSDTARHERVKINAREQGIKNIKLFAGDQVRINERFETAVAETIKITGEVRNPGTYDLMRGDTLSSVIERAGGMTDQAYPPAAVLSRKTERKREEQKFRSAAQQLEQTVSVNLNAKGKEGSLTPAQISMARDLANDLRSVKAVGRVTVEADPLVLAARPELDVLVEDGDRIHIPKRNLTVRVTGEVMNSASLLFEDEKDPQDYIREAGGMTYYADKSRVFVLYPDGSSEPLRSSAWRTSKPAMIIPGSTIIVPRDPKPFDFVDSFKDISQILTNMAITTVFIDDVVSD